MSVNIPSQNPAVAGNLGATVITVIRKELQRTEGQLPAKVISYNRAKNVAKVEICIAMLTTGGKTVQRAQVAQVPVLALGGGGFFINFPLVAGNTGWIEASDRDISLFLQSFQNVLPNTKRMHKFSDGRFVPDVFNAFTIAGADTNSMVISSVDGTVRMSLSPNTLTLTAPTINLNATTLNINATTINTTASGTITETATAIVENAPISMPDGATIGGIPFGTHRHGGVQTGTGDSTGPI